MMLFIKHHLVRFAVLAQAILLTAYILFLVLTEVIGVSLLDVQNLSRQNDDNHHLQTDAEKSKKDNHLLMMPIGEEEIIELWRGQEVDRVPLENLSHRFFFENYVALRKPLVISNAYKDHPTLLGDEWGFEALKKRYGSLIIDTRIDTPEDVSKRKGCTGTGLCEWKPMRLDDLLSEYFKLSSKKAIHNVRDIPYPHDLSLELAIPEMFHAYRKLNFFGENLLLSNRDGQEHWPSLFLGAVGTQTRFHVDSMGTSFTMAVFRGRKQFLLLDATDGDKLCRDNPLPHLDYGIEAFDPDFERCPSAREATAIFANVTAGDVLFLPGSFHHAARNIQDSIAVSQNFLSVYDYRSVMESYLGSNHNSDNNKPIPVSMDFLAIRSLYRLLYDTKYISSWDGTQMYWKADEARAEAFGRIQKHLQYVLDQDASRATDLAFMSCPTFQAMALRAVGLWDDCWEPADRQQLFTRTVAYGVKFDALGRLEHAAKLAETEGCRKGLSTYVEQVETEANKAASSLHREPGLSNTVRAS